jgi:hypothetical protein
MIHYVATENGSVSIRRYLAGEGPELADRMRVVTYEELARMHALPLGTWVFAEKDRLDAAYRDLATLVAERLEGAGCRARMLNDPRRVRLRFDLLRAAHEAGVNEHRAIPATDIRFGTRNGAGASDSRTFRADSLRYPVFVRLADDHSGNLSPLIDSPTDLATALASVLADGARRHELLVVEFCDTRDEHGLFRKYSAYNVGGRIIPRTIECSREWMVKWRGRVLDRERADDEIRYCETNPHEQWIREMFCLARIDYGRIDYGVLDGTPRLWEVNTHPWIGSGLHRHQQPEIVAYRRMIEPARAMFFDEFRNAWAAVDTPASDGESVALEIPDALRRAIERSEKQRRKAARLSSILNVVERQRGGYRMTNAVKRGLTPILAAWLRTDPS